MEKISNWACKKHNTAGYTEKGCPQCAEEQEKQTQEWRKQAKKWLKADNYNKNKK